MSCSSAVANDLGIQAAVLRLRELGFRYVDVFVFDDYAHLGPSRLAAGNRDEAEALMDAVVQSGMRVSSLNCLLSGVAAVPGTRAQVGKEYLALLEVAEEVGCPNLTVQVGGILEGQDFAAAFDAARDGLLWLHSLAEDRSTTLSFEAHVGSVVEKPAEALRMAESLWPAVGVSYDPSHFAMQEIPFEDTEPLLEYAVHVHVRNASPGRMVAPMAEGTVDFPRLVAALNERRYEGAVAIEYLDPEDEADVVTLRDLLVQLAVEL
ncbi:MAG: sugar phosphate isomerase/epimerase family protein [Planctomycetota bacterium]